MLVLEYSKKLEVNFGSTDSAISSLEPWRTNMTLQVFASRIRFQIRVDDIRELATTREVGIDAILEFYNAAIDSLLNQYTAEVRGNRQTYWR